MKKLRSRLAKENGLTLVELLMASTIIIIAVGAIIAGIGTAAITSVQHRAQANVNSLIVSVAESVKGQAYQACPSPAYSKTAGVTYPAGYSSSNVTLAYRFWNATNFQNSCPGGGDQGLQEVVVTVASPDGRASQTMSLTKRT